MEISSEVFGNAVADACRAGIESERERWAKKLRGLICIDHDRRGCDHSACYTLEDILTAMVPNNCELCDGDRVIDEGDVDGVATVRKCDACG